MRNLKRYMSGDDVWEVKNKLLELGYLSKATHKTYGNDTFRAVKTFQQANGLEVDGITGPLTYAALFGQKPVEPVEIPGHISPDAARVISTALAGVSKMRQAICLEALKWCVDPNGPHEDMRAFYIRGGNLYDQDLTAHLMTESRLNKYFKRNDYAPYYDKGREEVMRAMAARQKYSIAGTDCSGLIVGLWRRVKVVGAGFDATADRLYGSYCVTTKSPQPGDLAWKSGHIGLYVGGYVVEAAGGAFGVQLTKDNKRTLWDYVNNRKTTQKGWSAYGDPKYY